MTSMFDDLDKTISELTTEEGDTALTRDNLYKRLLTLEEQVLTVTEDIKQAKADFTYDEDVNPKGLSKEEVKEIAAYAKKAAKDGVDKIIEDGKLFADLKEEFGQ